MTEWVSFKRVLLLTREINETTSESREAVAVEQEMRLGNTTNYTALESNIIWTVLTAKRLD